MLLNAFHVIAAFFVNPFLLVNNLSHIYRFLAVLLFFLVPVGRHVIRILMAPDRFDVDRTHFCTSLYGSCATTIYYTTSPSLVKYL